MSAIILHEPGHASIPAPTADMASGAVFSDTALGCCIKEGLNPANAIGDPIKVRYDGLAAIPAASATTFAKGVAVQYNVTTNLAVASGDFLVGRAVQAKTSGQTSVLVWLNKAAV